MNQIIPIPKNDVSIREATLADIPYIDALQKKHRKQVGWMPTKQLAGKIGAGQVLVAEVADDRVARCGGDTVNDQLVTQSPFHTVTAGTTVGYIIGQDRYFKRDDVGIIYQLLVEPGKRRGFVGAALLKAMFDQSAYGCRLFCCWCAQDIEANRFWEQMGFVPLAFRTGSRGARVGRGCTSSGRSGSDREM